MTYKILAQREKAAARLGGDLAAYQKNTSFRASAHTGVGIPWILEYFASQIGIFTSIYGIATPVCGLVRDDVRIFTLSATV